MGLGLEKGVLFKKFFSKALGKDSLVLEKNQKVKNLLALFI